MGGEDLPCLRPELGEVEMKERALPGGGAREGRQGVLGVVLVEEEDLGDTGGRVSAPATRCGGTVIPCCAR